MVTLWPPIQEAEPEIDPDNWATEPPRAATPRAAASMPFERRGSSFALLALAERAYS